MHDISAKRIGIALALTALSAALLYAALSLLGPDWSVYAPASCTTTRCFCELPRTGSLILQPSDSWSAFGYVWVGFLMIVLAQGRGWTSAMPRMAASIFGLTAIIVGLGSVLLHATLTLWGQFFDVLGMYLIGAFMVMSALARWRNIADDRAIWLYLGLCAVLVTVLIVAPEARRWLFAVVLLGAILLEMVFARPRRRGVRVHYYVFGIVAKAVAFAIWTLDQNLLWCNPTSMVQGHAVWHLLGAMSLFLTFAYYRSERR